MLFIEELIKGTLEMQRLRFTDDKALSTWLTYLVKGFMIPC